MKASSLIRMVNELAAGSVAQSATKNRSVDRDALWLQESGLAIDGLNIAAEQIQYARTITAEVAHAATPQARRIAEAKVDVARERAWRTATATVASLLAALVDHPFTLERPEYPAPRN